MKLTWCTDIHLDHASNEQLISLGEKIREAPTSGVLLTGDISDANKLVYHLSALEKVVEKPIYFVLGNHDFYNSSIDDVRKQMKKITNLSSYLRYLPLTQYQVLTKNTAVIGHDGWYDCLNGLWDQCKFEMYDWVMIKDYLHTRRKQGIRYVFDRQKIAEVSRLLATEAVQHVHDGIKAAVRYHNNIIIATHVPPFYETHFHLGKPGEPQAHPVFTSKLMGDMLLAAGEAYPDVKFTVVAGHTHGACVKKIRKNMIAMVGGAEYRDPSVAGVIEVE